MPCDRPESGGGAASPGHRDRRGGEGAGGGASGAGDHAGQWRDAAGAGRISFRAGRAGAQRRPAGRQTCQAGQDGQSCEGSPPGGRNGGGLPEGRARRASPSGRSRAGGSGTDPAHRAHVDERAVREDGFRAGLSGRPHPSVRPARAVRRAHEGVAGGICRGLRGRAAEGRRLRRAKKPALLLRPAAGRLGKAARGIAERQRADLAGTAPAG